MTHKAALIEYLAQCLTAGRLQRMEEVLSFRTRYLTVVLENIYQSQNASAVIRTCDCTGIQDIHVIENHNRFELNPDVVLGANNWLNIYRYHKTNQNSLNAILSLKKQGYRIVATTPHSDGIELPSFDLEKGKAAFFFGTELKGLSDVVLTEADEFVKIPMHGFTESYNISVSAALILYSLTQRLHSSNIDWHLSEEEITDLKILWYTNNIDRGDLVVKRFYEDELKKRE